MNISSPVISSIISEIKNEFLTLKSTVIIKLQEKNKFRLQKRNTMSQ